MEYDCRIFLQCFEIYWIRIFVKLLWNNLVVERTSLQIDFSLHYRQENFSFYDLLIKFSSSMLKYIDGNSKNRPNLEVDMLIKATIALIKFTNLIFCHQKAFLIAYLLPGSNRINENDFFQLPCFVLLKVYFETVLKVFQELQLVTLKIFPN